MDRIIWAFFSLGKPGKRTDESLFFQLAVQAGNFKHREKQVHSQKVKRNRTGMIAVGQKNDDQKS
jgi:hypothetical protein